MKKFSFKCTCGDVMSVMADDMIKGKQMLKDMMTEAAIKKHWDERHAGQQPLPTVADEHAMIDSGTYEDMGGAPAM